PAPQPGPRRSAASLTDGTWQTDAGTMNEETARPDPDLLLRRVTAEEARAKRGKLKIFFGFAPGVGKTYRMLQVARELLAQQTDVAVGAVETHGRYETAALLLGLEVLPRRPLEYRGRALEEFA